MGFMMHPWKSTLMSKQRRFMLFFSRCSNVPIHLKGQVQKRCSHDQALRIAFCCDSRAVHHIVLSGRCREMHCSEEARQAAAQALNSAHIRHVHAFGGKAPSCCHALEARVLVKQERPSRSHSAVPALGLRTHAMNPPKMRHPCSLVV